MRYNLYRTNHLNWTIGIVKVALRYIGGKILWYYGASEHQVVENVKVQWISGTIFNCKIKLNKKKVKIDTASLNKV